MTEPDGGALVEGLWRRLRDVMMVARRVDEFTFGPGEDAPRRGPSPDDAGSIATDLVLRSMRAASDTLNFSILQAAASKEDGVPVENLIAAAGVPRLVITERISDLVQVGLMTMALDHDRAHATEAGLAVVEWIRNLSAGVAERVRREAGRDGLPLR